jgi:hypothetical protein
MQMEELNACTDGFRCLFSARQWCVDLDRDVSPDAGLQGVEVRLVVPRYGDVRRRRAGIVRVAGRPVPGDPEDRLVGWGRMHATVLAASSRAAT